MFIDNVCGTSLGILGDTWSIITTVPLGYQEFCFKVDGSFTVSGKHPTTPDGSCNWRTIYGPRQAVSKTSKKSIHWFVSFAESVADFMTQLLLPRVAARSHQQRPKPESHANPGRSERPQHLKNKSYDQKATSLKRMNRAWSSWADRLVKTAFLSVGLYATATVAYIVVQFIRGN